VTGSALTPGVIAAIQTFGDRINLHMHLHFLVTEGGTDEAAFRLYSRRRVCGSMSAAEESEEYFYHPNMLFELDLRIFRCH